MRLTRLFGVVLFVLGGCDGGEKPHGGEKEVCDNVIDDDDDGDADCDDADCAGACAAGTEADCADGSDDDGDGATDCDDDDCAAAAGCIGTEDCANAYDDDGDGDADCDDADCAADPACTTPATETDCADGLDDDGDGEYDCEDDDCAADATCLPQVETDCFDALDGDADGAIDCDDTDCAAVIGCVEGCENGVDDDDDGAVDCLDAECLGHVACVEDCADGLDNDADEDLDCDDLDCVGDPACPEICDNFDDDDGDGDEDCDDLDCEGDPACAFVCGAASIGSALGAAVATGTTVAAGDDYTPACSTTSTADDYEYSWIAPADDTYTITTDGSGYDTVLTLHSGDCLTELDCDDDGGEANQSLISFVAAAGDEFLIVVDGYYTGTGDYVLNIYTSSEGDCRDGVDGDGDGGADCADAECATDATCSPEGSCDDGFDDDLDGLTDCDDGDCAADLACTHPCAGLDLGSSVGDAIATGTTAGAGDDQTSTCASAATDDASFLWTAPADDTYTFDTSGSGFDALIIVQSADCSGTELTCDADDGAAGLALLSGDEVILVVDGVTTSGDYALDIWSSTEVACSNGADEDLDGLVDCDDDECVANAVCIPESVCDDALDSDIDGAPDCLDGDCAADAACDVSGADYDLGSTTGSAIATGDTTGAGDDHAPACTVSAAEDLTYAWVAPSTQTWTFDLSGSAYDTVIAVYDPSGVELACDDDGGTTGTSSLTTVALDAGQLVFIDIDGFSSGVGAYTLAIY